MPASIGVVAIGRNEGERLRRCLSSIPPEADAVVYVDSGSTDDSVAFARSCGCEVVELDLALPLTAARARNAGFARLLQLRPEVGLVFFVDGDCEVAPGWLSAARAALAVHADVAAVWGRRRERAPEQSVYNRVCDLEWSQAPFGESPSFGGDVVLRASVVREVGGYVPTLLAGEDPELSLRVRQRGHRILHLDAEMTVHDAAMTTARQWWRRAKRTGYAYAQVSALHAGEAERFWVRDRRRALAFGLALPLAAVLLSPPTLGLSAALLGAYPLRALRIAGRERAHGRSPAQARVWALHCVLSSLPQAVGVAEHALAGVRGAAPRLIEYKAETTRQERRQ